MAWRLGSSEARRHGGSADRWIGGLAHRSIRCFVASRLGGDSAARRRELLNGTTTSLPGWVQNEEDQTLYGKASALGAGESVLSERAVAVSFIATKESTGRFSSYTFCSFLFQILHLCLTFVPFQLYSSASLSELSYPCVQAQQVSEFLSVIPTVMCMCETVMFGAKTTEICSLTFPPVTAPSSVDVPIFCSHLTLQS